MEAIAEIIKNILVIIIVTSFLELMLPEGGMRPFVRFAMGLFIIVAILNPVLSFVFDKHTFEIDWWDTGSSKYQEQQITQAGRDLNERISNLSNQDLQQKLEGQINSLILLVPEVKEAHTQVETDDTGGVQRMGIKVIRETQDARDSTLAATSVIEEQKAKQESETTIRRKINELLKNLYGFENVQVEVVFEGG